MPPAQTVRLTPDDQPEIDADCVKALFLRARKATLLSPVGTLFVFWLVKDLVPLSVCLIWMLLNTLPDAITFQLTSRLLKNLPPDARMPYWRNWQLLLRSLQGLSWGSATIFFHVEGPASLLNDLTIWAALIAVSSAGIVNTAPSFRTSLGFTLGVLSVPIVFYFWLGDPTHVKMALGTALLLPVELQFGWDAYRQFREGVHQVVLNRRISHQLELRNDELDELNQRLSVLATHDNLTGLYNRHFIVDQLKHQREQLLRHGSPCSIVLIDIDYFKRVNDRYGHSVGDDVLVAFSRRLETLLRQGDTPGRHGGEEFLLVLPMTEIAAALQVAERIRSMLENTPLIDKPVPLRITASAGVAQLRKDEAIDAWLVRADQALYRAKENGRNCVIAD